MPVDISGDFLRESAAGLQAEFPGLPVFPVEADFTRQFGLPAGVEAAAKLGFFPGSTIGNFVARSAVDLLRAMKETLGEGAKLVIGMDRIKDVDTLIRAYDDAAGVTAAFNLNLLHRINPELDGDIPVEAFRHRAIWNDALSRIEMHLEAVRDVALHGLRPALRLPGRRDHPHRKQPQIWPSRQPHPAPRRRLGRGRGVDRRARMVLHPARRGRAAALRALGKADRSWNGCGTVASAPLLPLNRRRYSRRSTPAPETPCCLPCSRFVDVLLQVLFWIIIIQAVLSWLVVFNVINTHNDFVRTFFNALDRLTRPLYAPIRKILPDFGGLDFSPVVVLLLIFVLRTLLAGLARDLVRSGTI